MRVVRFRQRFRSAPPEKARDALPFGPHARQIELGSARARDHDEIDALGNQPRPCAEALAAQAFDAISPDRVANPSSHDKAEPRRSRSGLGSHEEREVRCPYPTCRPLALGPHELHVLAKPAVGAEGHALGSNARRLTFVLGVYFL
jgi:hypothetical protein